jgi:hypothetical protein
MIKAIKMLLGGLAVVGFANWANAAAELSIYDGVNPLITVFDNGPGDQFPASGQILVQTNIGFWYLTISSAVTKPVLGSATDPVMSLFVQANSSAAGTLRFVFSDNSFGPATGTLNATGDGQVISGAAATLSFDVYGDPANVAGATTVPLATTGTIGLPGSATGSGSLTLGAPYSLTEVVLLTASGATSVSSDESFDVVPVPEPGVVGLAALGLAAWTFRKISR